MLSLVCFARVSRARVGFVSFRFASIVLCFCKAKAPAFAFSLRSTLVAQVRFELEFSSVWLVSRSLPCLRVRMIELFLLITAASCGCFVDISAAAAVSRKVIAFSCTQRKVHGGRIEIVNNAEQATWLHTALR